MARSTGVCAWAVAALVLREPGLGEVFAASILGGAAAGGWGNYRGRQLDFINMQAWKDDRYTVLGLPRAPELGKDASAVTAAAARVAERAWALHRTLTTLDPQRARSAEVLSGQEAEVTAIQMLLDLNGRNVDVGGERYLIRAYRRPGATGMGSTSTGDLPPEQRTVLLRIYPAGRRRFPRPLTVTVVSHNLYEGAAAVPRRTGLARFDLQINAAGNQPEDLREAIAVSLRD